MTTNRRASTTGKLRSRSMFALLAVLMAACGTEPSSSTSPGLNAPLAARATGDVVVSSAAPDSAVQDTTLDVTIGGSGFVSGSTARWALAGVSDSTQIRTNSTRYVNSRTLVANVTIGSTATTGKWDVVVTSGSKGGIGTELFTVKGRDSYDSDSRALLVWDSEVNIAAPGEPVNMQPAGVVGDGRGVTGLPSASSQYQGAFCGVAAKVFWNNPSMSRSGDLVFSADMDYSNSMTVCGSKRTLYFYLSYQAGGSRGASTAMATFSNARAVMQLAPGEIRSQLGGFGLTGLKLCDRIAFERATYPSSANLRVTRLPDVNGARKWRVESEYPHVGICTQASKATSKGTMYLPFAYTATEVPSPYPTYR